MSTSSPSGAQRGAHRPYPRTNIFYCCRVQSRKVQSMVLSLAQLARLDLLRYWNETTSLQVRCVSLAFAAIWNSLDIPAPCDCSSAIKPQVSAVCPSATTWASGATLYAYGSGFFFYLFFYSFAEYVHIDTSNYLKAPGPSCGAEGRWRNVVLTGPASV